MWGRGTCEGKYNSDESITTNHFRTMFERNFNFLSPLLPKSFSPLPSLPIFVVVFFPHDPKVDFHSEIINISVAWKSMQSASFNLSPHCHTHIHKRQYLLWMLHMKPCQIQHYKTKCQKFLLFLWGKLLTWMNNGLTWTTTTKKGWWGGTQQGIETVHVK